MKMLIETTQPYPTFIQGEVPPSATFHSPGVVGLTLVTLTHKVCTHCISQMGDKVRITDQDGCDYSINSFDERDDVEDVIISEDARKMINEILANHHTFDGLAAYRIVNETLLMWVRSADLYIDAFKGRHGDIYEIGEPGNYIIDEWNNIIQIGSVHDVNGLEMPGTATPKSTPVKALFDRWCEKVTQPTELEECSMALL